MHRIAIAIVVAAFLGFEPAQAEIFRWTDASGRVHYTQDLSQVPPSQRGAARRGAEDNAPEGRVQTFSSPSRSTLPPASRAADARDGEVVRVPVSRAGTSMLVNVRLNGAVNAPFLIDTGASDVLIPEKVADRLGLRVGPDTRTKVYATANGNVEHPVVMLDSVNLGGAVVEAVPASISPHMEVGLLGLTYFNHFDYQVDAARGVVTLRRNDLAESGAIRGGRSQAQWQAEFHNLEARLESLDRDIDRQGSGHDRQRRLLHEAREDLLRQRSLLRGEADRARVPMAWRQ